jgi:hypothetical protein
VQIYSELDVNGHTSDSIRRYGWWVFDKQSAINSVLFFAIIAKEKADGIMAGIMKLKKEFDPDHPPRAFQIDVEKLV